MSEPCARLWEIDPYREGRLGAKDARSFERHLTGCGTCRSRLDGDERLRELARALPTAEPSELRSRRVRTRVMRDAATGLAPSQGSRRLVLGVAAMVVVALAAAWALVALRSSPHAAAPVATFPGVTTAGASAGATARPPETEPLAGSVVASVGARWSQARAQRVERVGLDDGLLRVHVRPQEMGERFLVTLPDGELEVRGTTFDVNVADGVTARVHVDEGVVEVRLRGQAARRLGATETWTAVEAIASHPTATRSPSSSPPAAALRAPAAETDGVAAYTAAMGLLRGGRNEEAASAFHAFVLSEPGAPQAEDASFLEAVALARAGRSDAAALAAEHHLAGFPRSFHRREAAILVGRAAVQRGDCGNARAVLAPWTGAKPDPEAHAALRSCDEPAR